MATINIAPVNPEAAQERLENDQINICAESRSGKTITAAKSQKKEIMDFGALSLF